MCEVANLCLYASVLAVVGCADVRLVDGKAGLWPCSLRLQEVRLFFTVVFVERDFFCFLGLRD